MTRDEQIRQELADDGIEVLEGLPIKRKSIVDPEGYIGLSREVTTSAERYCVLEHDKWHLRMGAFYPLCSPYQIRAQIEYRVTKRALMEAVPVQLLKEYLGDGLSLDEAAELLEVPPQVLVEAIGLYREMGMPLRGREE